MTLKTYRKKRDFAKTQEPRGGKRTRAKRLRFVVQEHHARRLHYDFRLEWEGVLKSWAVPKGPSVDPRDKRLAVQTEDHPLEYGNFEGTIPAGEYGAGDVTIWDRGEWTPLEEPSQGFREGKLTFTLHGEKLRGSWALVRRGGLDADDGKNWLLIKHRDEYAEGDGTPNGTGKSSPRSARVHVPVPKMLQPQLATLAKTAPEGDRWLHEIKLDGYRMLCRIDRGKARFISRNGKDWTERFSHLARAAIELPANQAFLDGEVVWLEPSGISNFQNLQTAFQERRANELVYFVFDVLHLDGEDLTALTLDDRKRRLAALVPPSSSGLIRYTDHITGDGPAFFREACRMGLEGTMSKRRDGVYRVGRTGDWVKAKCVEREEFVIGGYTDPTGSRSAFGALLLGYYDAAQGLQYAGRVGTGFNEALLVDLHRRLKAVARTTSPFDVPVESSDRRGIHWVRAELVAQVEFRGWTREGLLRQASFQGLREDKAAREVVRETVSGERSEPRDIESEGRPNSTHSSRVMTKRPEVRIAGVPLSNPDKVLYPEPGITKRALAEYYEQVADWILPHLRGRPLAVVRCPEGHKRKCFYQKHARPGIPEALGRVPVEEGGKMEEYLVVHDLAGLISLVQIGVLEVHVWGSRQDMLEKPDRLVIDLDPDPALAWPHVVRAAFRVRELLGEWGLASFAKTTGGKGLHVVVPVERRRGWAEARQFCRSVAVALATEDPKLYTASMSKAARVRKIYIDYLRNDRGSTAIVAYSTRARTGAPVSVPLTWGELESGIRSDQYTIANLPSRLASLRHDPWEALSKQRQSVPLAQ